MKPAVTPSLTFARGFSLTEMAVVLVIVAILIAGLVIPLATQQDIRARQDTENMLTNLREALLGYAASHAAGDGPRRRAGRAARLPASSARA